MFSYTLATDGSLQELDLESPRVKNAPLKSFFCLAYFAMTYVTLQDLIVEQLIKLEQTVNGSYKIR